jgi:5'-nucleotidase (lipoprotein e(P4) family)
MKKLFFIAILFSIGFLSSCECKNETEHHEDQTTITSDHLTMATLYQQTAAEYRALCYQAFNIARLKLDINLKQRGLSKQRAIVVDIDETVLDNSPQEAMCILNNTNYPDYWDEWMNVKDAKPVPGSLEFLQYAASNGVEVFYISNRKDQYKEQTLTNLVKLGFPNADSAHILLKTDDSSKKARRDKVLETHQIIMLMGDNLNDFSEVFEKLTIENRFTITDKHQSAFGNKFIVLPNAMYGEWEGALYNYDYSLSKEKKAELRKENLIGF